MADIFGIPRGTYAHYELGKRRPDHDMLIKFAEYYNVSTDYLLGRSDLDWLNNIETMGNSTYNILEQIESTLDRAVLSEDTKQIIRMIIKNDPFVKNNNEK